jgi:hypothetical protein
MMAARRCLVHPFLIALFFVLTLAASNAAALNGLRDLAWPVSVSFVVCALFWLLGFALTHDAPKASLLAFLWVTAFSLFGYVAEVLHPTGTLQRMGGSAGLVGLFVVALFGPSWAVCRMVGHLDTISRYLAIVGALLVGYTGVQLLRGMRQAPDQRELLSPPIISTRAESRDLPNIYLIILDKYTGSEVLAQNFGFDNSTFDMSLRNRGFIVPKHSRANYPQTILALAAMLNLEYIHNLPQQSRLEDLIENNRLAAFLKLRGYRFVFFPTPYRFTHQNRNADLQIPDPGQVRGEFGAAWQQSTMLPELLTVGCAVVRCRSNHLRYVPEDAKLMDLKFELIGDLADDEPPTFAFAHVSLPHEPYIYNADCTHRDPYWPLGTGHYGDSGATQGYLNQIRCTNRKVAVLVDSILSRSRRPPVILIQADHGHGRLGNLPAYKNLNASQLRERMSVFSAYYLPGVDAGAISDSITPVNVMRLMLRHYFGADVPPTEDASYWSPEVRPLDLVRVKW